MASIFGRQTNAPSVAKVSAPGRGGKRRLSPQALANIRAAQKKRWAQFRAGVAKSSSKAATPKKRGGLTAEGRKKLALAMKRRWAAAKAGKAPAPTAPKG